MPIDLYSKLDDRKKGIVMPIKVQSDLPAKETLERENVFTMDEKRAIPQTAT